MDFFWFFAGLGCLVAGAGLGIFFVGLGRAREKNAKADLLRVQNIQSRLLSQRTNKMTTEDNWPLIANDRGKRIVELLDLLEQWVKSEAVSDRNQQIAVQEVLANRTRDILDGN